MADLKQDCQIHEQCTKAGNFTSNVLTSIMYIGYRKSVNLSKCTGKAGCKM